MAKAGHFHGPLIFSTFTVAYRNELFAKRFTIDYAGFLKPKLLLFGLFLCLFYSSNAFMRRHQPSRQFLLLGLIDRSLLE